MNNIPFCIRIALFAIMVSTGALVLSAGPTAGAGQEKGWSWPPPPEQPRVQHVRTFITPQDLGITKGFFAKLWEFITGEETQDRILSPHGIAADGQGKVYVADWGGRCVHLFDFERKNYDKFSETKLGPLYSPIGAAVDGEGRVYITDSVLRRVFVFKGTKNKSVIGDDASFLRPTGVAVNARERLLYVVDTLGHRVDVFTLEGTKKFSFGTRGSEPGEFNFPTHVAVDRNGDLYVMDTLNFRVQIFTKEGTFVRQFGGTGTAINEFIKPKGIAVDSDSHVWVSDEMRNSIQVFDREGNLLLIFGRSGIETGEFSMPSGLFIDSRGRFYVADSYNYRVQEFQYLP